MSQTKKSKTELSFEDKLRIAVDFKKTSCMWDDGDWNDRFELQRKYAYGYLGKVDQSKGYKSNVKSPEISGRVQSTLQKLAKLHLGWVVRSVIPEGKFAAELNQLVLDQATRKANVSYRLADSYQDVTVHGTAALGVDWLKMGRNVEMPVMDVDSMTKEEKKAYEEKNKIPTRKIYLVDFEGLSLSNYKLEDIYVDPAALSLNTGINRAGYAFKVEYISMDRFKALYPENEFKNVKNVKPAGGIKGEDDTDDENGRFLARPMDDESEMVEIIKMYGYDDDKYMIRANGVYIYEGPLPYIDKKIPISFIRGYKPTHQLMGIGVPDLLMPVVTQIELLTNAAYDYTMYTANPWLGISKQDFSSVQRLMKISNGIPGSLFPITQPNSITPIKFQPLSVDLFQSLAQLQRDAVIASQQDPTQLGMMKKNSTATANLINKEIAEGYINYMIENFKEDLEDVGAMMLSRIHQFMTKAEVKKIKGEEGKEEYVEQYPTIEIEGKKVDIDWDSRSVKVTEDANETSFIELRPEMFSYEDDSGKRIEFKPNDFGVYLRAENLQIQSKALEQQEAGEMLATLSAFMVDSSNPAKVAQHPMPLVDAAPMLEEVFDKKGWPKKFLLQYSGLEQNSINRAKAQNMEAFQGIRSLPHAGESKEHINIHTAWLKGAEERLEVLTEDVSTLIKTGQQPQPEVKQEFDQLVRAVELMSEHMKGDMMSPYQEAFSTLEKGQAMSGGQQPQAPMPQGQGGMGLEGLGGNQPMPNDAQSAAQQAGYTGGPGEQMM